MSAQAARGPIVIDTDVFGADLVRGSTLADMYEPIIVGRAAFISFQTAAELRYGALRRYWGEARMRKLEARINQAEIVHSGPGLVDTYAQLRVACERRARPSSAQPRRRPLGRRYRASPRYPAGVE